MPGPQPTALLVTDFDGTLTTVDFYKIALERFTPPETRLVWERYLRKELTVFETLQAVFASIGASEAEVLAALADLKFDPGAAAAVQQLQRAGWEVVVASAGCEWYVRRVLAAAGIDIVVHANPGEFIEGRGLQMTMATDSPFLSARVGVDKAAIVRHGLTKYAQVAFAGDSAPDLDAARLVSDDLRFARSQLAELLEREERPYHRYSHWAEIAEVLLARPPLE